MTLTNRNVMALLWTGPIGIVLVLVGWMVLAGFLPPPSPDLSADAVSAMWQHNTTLKRVGMILCVWGGSLYVPFTVGVAVVLWRLVDAARPWVVAQAALGTFGAVFFTLNFLVLAVVAYRPERDSQVTQLLHDLGFTMTFSPVAPFTFQYVAIAVALMQPMVPRQAIPRWVAYVNLWVAILLIPACLIPMFKTGPVAWDGVLSFWIPVFVFVAWFFVMFWTMRGAILRSDAVSVETSNVVAEKEESLQVPR